jgi:hypothetical protein
MFPPKVWDIPPCQPIAPSLLVNNKGAIRHTQRRAPLFDLLSSSAFLPYAVSPHVPHLARPPLWRCPPRGGRPPAHHHFCCRCRCRPPGRGRRWRRGGTFGICCDARPGPRHSALGTSEGDIFLEKNLMHKINGHLHFCGGGVTAAQAPICSPFVHLAKFGIFLTGRGWANFRGKGRKWKFPCFF